jgi:hypothetical protein
LNDLWIHFFYSRTSSFLFLLLPLLLFRLLLLCFLLEFLLAFVPLRLYEFLVFSF